MRARRQGLEEEENVTTTEITVFVLVWIAVGGLVWTILTVLERGVMARYEALDEWLTWTMAPLYGVGPDESARDLEERVEESERRMADYGDRSTSAWRTWRDPRSLWPEQLRRERAGAEEWTPRTEKAR